VGWRRASGCGRCGRAVGPGLRRHHERDLERARERAQTRVEPRGVRGTGETEAGEVMVVLPFVEQRVQEHLGGDHLLTHRGPVVDADSSSRHRALHKGAAVVPVRLALQPLSVVRVDLGSVSHDQVAVGEAGERIELIDEQLTEALDVGAEIVLLDNMTAELMRQAVEITAGRAKLEASGGMTLEGAVAAARAGVDRISVGALTHSAPALDLSLEVTRTWR